VNYCSGCLPGRPVRIAILRIRGASSADALYDDALGGSRSRRLLPETYVRRKPKVGRTSRARVEAAKKYKEVLWGVSHPGRRTEMQAQSLGAHMELDTDKIDQAALALLALGRHEGNRAWKAFDWEVMGRLHAKGYIHRSGG